MKFEIVKNEFRKHLEKEIKLPNRATARSGGYDFYSPSDYKIKPYETVMIWTDVKAKIDIPNVELVLNVRSSMGKHHVSLANTQGWIDADYYGNVSNDGNIGIMLYNLGETDYIIHEGDRISQGMFIPYVLVDGDDCIEERDGGFGSTN